jgi:hypothetical protein
LILANAAHIRNVPGRKSDVNDATWIAELLAHGLIRASFVPQSAVPRRGKVVAGFASVSPALRIAWVTSFTVRSRHPTACRGSATRMARP